MQSILVISVWRSGSVVGHINQVTLRQARLVLVWVTVLGQVTQSLIAQSNISFNWLG